MFADVCGHSSASPNLGPYLRSIVLGLVPGFYPQGFQ
jgi:hypothetical protein